MSKKYTFEDCLSFIEDKLGVQLLSWQKDLLQRTYNGEYGFYITGRSYGGLIAYEATKMLKELIKEET